MTTPSPTHLPATPSVDQVVAALNRTALPRRARLRLSSAAMLTLVMGAALVLLLAAFMAFSWVLVRETERLVIDIRHQRTTPAEAIVISATDLLDEEVFARLAQERPARTAELYRQRALARSRDSAAAGAARQDFAQASQLDPQVIQANDRLFWADLELQQGNPERARTLLRDCDLTLLTTAQQQHLTRLLLTLHDTSRR